MAKKKKDNDNNTQKKNQEADIKGPKIEPIFTIPTYKIPPIPIPKITIPTIPVPKIIVPPLKYTIPSFVLTESREQKLQEEIIQLRKEVVDLHGKGEKVDELQKTITQLEKKGRLSYLLSRVNGFARQKLLESDELKDMFENTEVCNMAIMSVDIRRSTELMLKARKPQLYAGFITNLCSDLTSIIFDNFGVFDKFTGDGILAFFPDFYSGEDAPYLAIKTADECHRCFSEHYEANRNCFKSIILDVGLGIGIDYGESHLIKIQDGLTVIGEPVVYACRMSGGKAGQTLLNQPAYEVTSQKFGEYINFQESEIDIKHEGRILAYIATLSKKSREPKLPDWLSSRTQNSK